VTTGRTNGVSEIHPCPQPAMPDWEFQARLTLSGNPWKPIVGSEATERRCWRKRRRTKREQVGGKAEQFQLRTNAYRGCISAHKSGFVRPIDTEWRKPPTWDSARLRQELTQRHIYWAA
jgi:hypothetical protein